MDFVPHRGSLGLLWYRRNHGAFFRGTLQRFTNEMNKCDVMEYETENQHFVLGKSGKNSFVQGNKGPGTFTVSGE